MMYLLADPGIIYLDLPDPPRQSVERLIERIFRWNHLRNEYDIEIVMTERCRNAISETIHKSYTMDALQPVFASLSHDIINSISPLLNSLLAAKKLDPLLTGIDNNNFNTTGLVDKMVVPENYGKRQKSLSMRYAFYDMLWRVVVARKHLDNPPVELEETAVLTAFDGRKDWYEDYVRNLFVIVGWDEDDPHKKSTIVENLPVIDIDEEQEALELILRKHPRKEFRSLLHTVEEAVKTYKDILFLSSQGRKHAGRSVDFDDKQKIYRLIVGLVEVWLPAYKNGGQDAANHAFKARFGCDIAHGYGQATLRNPGLAKQLDATFDGETKPRIRHIKLSDSANVFRIHFQEKKMKDGSYRLILGWIGRHPKTAMFGA